MKRIVIVTYNWPPRNAMGTHRPYSWAKYWSVLGHEVIVLTACKAVYDEPLDLVLPPLPQVRVVEIPYAPRFKAGSERGGSGGGSFKIFLLLRAMKRWVTKTWGLRVDLRDGWARAALAVAEDLARDVDVVVSTFGPKSSHLIASRMKTVNGKLFWVADYRDLWSQNHLAGYSKRAREREKCMELATVGGLADLVTTVSEEWARDLSGLLGRPVEVVWNGFDTDDAVFGSRVAALRQTGKGGALKIVHTGMIYEGRRDPSVLFTAIRELIDERVICSGDIEVQFYGARLGGLREIVGRCSASEFVTIHGHVGRQIALEAQAQAGGLLLLESGEADALGVVPGKLFEYLSAVVPIISLGSAHDSAVGRMLEFTRTGVCLQEVQEVKATLLSLLGETRPSWFSPDLERIQNFSRRSQAVRMLELMGISDASHGLVPAST